jgi:excisionase family DNA binding protein
MTARPFSAESLSERWGCSSETVRQMCRRGDLGYFRLGKLIRIPASEVERIECQTGDSSSTEDNTASLTAPLGVELRLARLIGDGPKLSLVNCGGGSTDRHRNG